DGRIGEYVGGYSDWLRQQPDARVARRERDEPAKAALREASAPETAPVAPAATPARRKLGYRESRELEQLPQRIEQLESEIAALTQAMQAPTFYQQDGAAIAAANQRLAQWQAELDAAYARWAELDA